MMDQLHSFATEAERDAAFPRPLDDEGNPMAVPCWMIGDATVMPVEILLWNGTEVVRSASFWMGVAGTNLDAFWLPSCAVELARPDEPTPWLQCVKRSRLTPEQAAPVVGVSPMFAGSAYVFPSYSD